jgi:hypothetical protein
MHTETIRHGISAVMLGRGRLDEGDMLELGAVLEALVGSQFEVLLVTDCPNTLSSLVDNLRASTPALPLRVVEGSSLAAGCAAATYDVFWLSGDDRDVDVRQTNRLFDAIEHGADAAAGYRPRRSDGLFRYLQRWGCNVSLDCAVVLMRRHLWQTVLVRHDGAHATVAEVVVNARKLGYCVSEIPVSCRRPSIETVSPAARSWAA